MDEARNNLFLGAKEDVHERHVLQSAVRAAANDEHSRFQLSADRHALLDSGNQKSSLHELEDQNKTLNYL